MTTTDSTSRATIDLTRLRRLVFGHWRAIVAGLLVGLLLAAIWSFFQPRKYTADAIAIVSTGSVDNLGIAVSADNLARAKATQYQELAKSRAVEERAVELASETAQQSGRPEPVLQGLSVAVPVDTPQITLSVTASTPEDARDLADAYVKALGESVEEIETAGAPASGEDQGSSTSQTSIIQLLPFVEARVPSGPSYPPTKLALATGALIGLLVGLAYAAVRSAFDRRIRSVKALEEMGLSAVGTIPKTDKASHSTTIVKEAFKELRTNLQFMNPDHPPRVVVVTSALPAEGKSTVAANLAISLAESGRPVTLVDGDLRRPTVAQSFGLVGSVGLTDVVVDRLAMDDALQHDPRNPDLAVLAAGTIPPNPSEILASDRLAHAIETLAKDSMVIIDAPPLLPVTDAAILGARFDGVLVVVNAGSTTIDELAKTRDSLERVNAHMLGAVLNRVPTGKLEGGAYSYYGSRYGYEYQTTEPDESGEGAPTRRARQQQRKKKSTRDASSRVLR
ncbi:capsular exopolysaccharide biosynthesis protein [Janibacter hoylei PVAS-1]|uniref:non-specific protein-tyrosine kinase n=1 Tax=Janibacter hoylei PVAS-1 TaxID=1210046 RepID=K1E4F0_9MICO|nr:polysaccharide biosynthesis tyrosine autokinase [Janibacter hoylei]EKA61956.1 capsular exopolysaccharide biosynthesis protein [Janibacter hoylei PVAS-1]